MKKTMNAKNPELPAYKKVKTDQLIPYEKNSRTHSEEQIQQICESIRHFGFLSPVVVNGKSEIIAGHARVMAAKRLGINEVPSIDASHLTEQQKKAYLIADNKLSANSEWDELTLKMELDDLLKDGFNLETIGFSDQEITDLLKGEEKLKETTENLAPITWNHLLISIPSHAKIEHIDDFIEQVKHAGGRVDYSGN